MNSDQSLKGCLTQSLEVLADKVGDPTPTFYKAFFARYPEFEPLFFLDPNGDVRGEMLSQALDVLMRADADDSSADILVQANRFAHDGYGVSEAQFDSFFSAVRDVVKDELGPDWSNAFEQRWSDVIGRLLNARG